MYETTSKMTFNITKDSHEITKVDGSLFLHRHVSDYKHLFERMRLQSILALSHGDSSYSTHWLWFVVELVVICFSYVKQLYVSAFTTC